MKHRLATAFLATFLLSLPATSRAANAIFGGDGEPAWSRLHQYLKVRFGSTNVDDVVLTLPSAAEVGWDDPLKPVRLMDMYEWGDLAPSDSWQYHRASSKRVSEGYAYFLSAAYNQHIAANGTINQTAKDAATRANEALNFRRDLYNKAVATSDGRYISYLATNPASSCDENNLPP